MISEGQLKTIKGGPSSSFAQANPPSTGETAFAGVTSQAGRAASPFQAASGHIPDSFQAAAAGAGQGLGQGQGGSGARGAGGKGALRVEAVHPDMVDRVLEGRR